MSKKNKNLIYIIGGAAVVGYYIWMKNKKSSDIQQEVEITTPDQQIAPAFVNEATDIIKAATKRLASKRSKSNRKKSNNAMDPMSMTENDNIPVPIEVVESTVNNSDGGTFTVKEAILQNSGLPLIKKSSKTVKQEIKASGGSAKQARQAAKTYRKEARKAKKVGELPVFF